MKKVKTNKGSALIIALLIMGILMTLALGLSNLVIREVSITTDIVNSGKAYFAAEAGIESALLDLHQNLPGYETEKVVTDGEFEAGNETYQAGISEDAGLEYDYQIENRTHTIPHIDTEIIDPAIVNADKSRTFNVLRLNETVTIPLFVSDESGETINVSDFRVEYYIARDAISPSWIGRGDQEDIDMLRWKITGIKELGASPGSGTNAPPKLLTESIGDYLPTISGSDENQRTCFGTEESLISRVFNGINYDAECLEATHGKIYSYAREAYTFDIRKNDEGEFEYVTVSHLYEDNDQMTIGSFLENHSHNYLTLTNIFNPSMIRGLSDFEKRQNARIYYRIVIPNENEYTIREFAKITSVGYVRRLRKRIEALIRPDKFMPVFNFSLYRTEVE
jgi:hypothetical protein